MTPRAERTQKMTKFSKSLKKIVKISIKLIGWSSVATGGGGGFAPLDGDGGGGGGQK